MPPPTITFGFVAVLYTPGLSLLTGQPLIDVRRDRFARFRLIIPTLLLSQLESRALSFANNASRCRGHLPSTYVQRVYRSERCWTRVRPLKAEPQGWCGRAR